jgi:hypothetical protein
MVVGLAKTMDYMLETQGSKIDPNNHMLTIYGQHVYIYILIV